MRILRRIRYGVVDRLYHKCRRAVFRFNSWRLNRKVWIELGEGTDVNPIVSFTRTCNSGGVIRVGKNCKLGHSQRRYWAGYCPPSRYVIWGGNAQIIIGDSCCLCGVNICARERVEIGDNCLFAAGIQILDSDIHKICSFHRGSSRDEPSPVKLGKNVWVGLNAMILKGSQIGDNCVVGAGAVVKGVFPANCVIAGNPARIVKRLKIEDFGE